ncbi:TPA: hypothetical protein ACH3X3_003635 [Trebouxia sp. C0006]
MLAAATVAAAAEVPAVGAAAAGDCVPLGPKIIFGKEWSTEDMAAAMAKITELEAATVQLEADKAELEASVRAKDTTLGDVAEMSLKAQGLPNGGAVGPAASSPLVSQSGHKRSHGHDGNGTAHAKGKKLKRKDFSKRAGSNSGGKDSFPP